MRGLDARSPYRLVRRRVVPGCLLRSGSGDRGRTPSRATIVVTPPSARLTAGGAPLDLAAALSGATATVTSAKELTARVHHRRARIRHPVTSRLPCGWGCVRRTSPRLPVTDLREPRNRRLGVCSPVRAEADRCTGDRVVWVRAGPARAARLEVSSRRCCWPCSVAVTGASPGPVAPVRALAAREEPRTAAHPAAVRVRTEEAPAAVAAESSPTVVWCCPPSFPVPRTTC